MSDHNEAGWIIEHPNHNSTLGHLYLRAIIEGEFGQNSRAHMLWDANSELALRFSRKQDGETFLLIHREFLPALVTEHAWIKP